MRTSLLVASVLSLGLGAFAVASVRSTVQEPVQPTEQHRHVLKAVGEWEGTLNYFMPGADEPMSAPATESIVSVGEFWTQSRFECEFMGIPYIGTGCMGYDIAKKKFVGTWIDSTTTYIAQMEGEMNADGALVMHWEAPDPMSGEIVQHRSVTAEADGKNVSTFYAGEGEGVKIMVIEMSRASKKPVEAGAGK